jgi:transketolase
MTAPSRYERDLLALALARFVDVGVCESTLVGVAAGLALRGRIPVVHALAAFLTMRAFEFIRTDVGLAGLPVKLVGFLPGFLSEANGPTHQALEDVALMRGVPGMVVACPADEEELSAALPVLLDLDAPCYLRYVAGPAAVRHEPEWVPGRAERIQRGRDVVFLTYGLLLRQVEEAVRLLRASGVSAGALNMRTVQPLDEAAVLEAAACGLLVTVEDHFAVGGLGSAVAEVLARRDVACRLHGVALEGRWFAPGLLHDVIGHERFDAPHLAARVEGLLSRKGGEGGRHAEAGA